MPNETIKGFVLSLAISMVIIIVGYGGLFLCCSSSSSVDSFAFIGGLAAVSLGAPLIGLAILFILYLKYRNSRPYFAKGILFFLGLLIILSSIVRYLIKFS